ICNPNNPTGTILPSEILRRWCLAHPDTLFVVDESYHAFAMGFQSAISLGCENLLVVRSMTKDYALAALRLGYAVGAEMVIEALRRVRPAWNVNALAQAAGLAALSDEEHLHRSLEVLLGATRVLRQEIHTLGWKPLPSAVHFFLMHVGNGAAFRSALLRYGILVRDCASFGLPAYVRIAPRRPEENVRLIAALRAITPSFLRHRDSCVEEGYVAE
ncbi:MAG: aminotransferase class I/II, partial [Ardenticatenia bacterium]